jgi:hypothetical protein
MLAIRRPVAILLSVLLVQLSLVGSGVCPDDGGSARTSMALADSEMCADGATAMDPIDPTPAPGSHPHHCATPWAPLDCSMLVACSAPSLPSDATTTLAGGGLDADLWADPPLLAPAPLVPPEPPPPRA